MIEYFVSILDTIDTIYYNWGTFDIFSTYSVLGSTADRRHLRVRHSADP